MPGFNASQLNYNARNANSVVVLIGDSAIAFAQTVDPSTDYGAEQLYGVGNAKPQEVQQLKISPRITLNQFALTAAGNALLQQGVNLVSILSNNQFNISVIDGNLNQVIYTYIGCVANTFGETISANQVVTDATTFLALDVVDQTGQSILNGPNAFTISAQVGVAGSGLGIAVTASA